LDHRNTPERLATGSDPHGRLTKKNGRLAKIVQRGM
jgi:hypothetical protein